MANLEPQTTGQKLGSKNPFIGLITPQPTGESSSASAGTSNGMTSTGAPSSTTTIPQTPRASVDEPVAPPLPPKVVVRQATGALNSSSTPVLPSSAPPVPLVSSPEQSVPQTRSPPPLPVRRPTEEINNVSNTNRAPSPARSATLDILQEDLPPEYTPGPNSLAGEQSVDFGPLRPFQDAGTRPRPGPQPLPNGPFIVHYRTPSGSGRNTGSLSQMLGSLVASYLADRGGSSNGYVQPRAQAPYGASITSQPPVQARPPMGYGGPQVQQSPQIPGGWPQYPGQRPRARTPEPRSPPLNDGKPTMRPSPGHPLIRNGQVLVYPVGYECRKCEPHLNYIAAYL
jgi:hypothetical protein